MENKNTTSGLNLELEEQQASEQDYIFGAGSQKCLVQIPEQEREQYLPRGELQFGREDFQDCATRSVVNLLETKFNFGIGIIGQK